MRILIAEDDGASRLILKRSIQKLGYECEEAENGDQADDKPQNADPDQPFDCEEQADPVGHHGHQREQQRQNAHRNMRRDPEDYCARQHQPDDTGNSVEGEMGTR